jgi:hypothetical protein
VVAEGVPVSSSGTTGDRLDSLIEGDIRASFRTGTGFVSGEKKVVINVYSAVALSIRTSSVDRNSDSIDAFCFASRIIRVHNRGRLGVKNVHNFYHRSCMPGQPQVHLFGRAPASTSQRGALLQSQQDSQVSQLSVPEDGKVKIGPRNTSYSSKFTFIQERLRVYRLNPVS